jgi:FkbM family methyltransferase
MLRRAVISTLQPLMAQHVYTVRHGLAKGLTRRGGLGFVPQLGKRPAEERFLEGLAFEGHTVFDVGGFEGIFTLFFARRAGPTGRLVTFEPNPHNSARIAENVRLNGFENVEIRTIALGAAPGRMPLIYPAGEAALGSLVADIQDTIRGDKHAATIDVDVETLDRLVAGGLPEPDFVKIDVEGFERNVLEGMAATIARRHPLLYIEVHGSDVSRKLENATSLVEYLWHSEYEIYHVESATSIRQPSDIMIAREGHLFCSSRRAPHVR